MYSIQNSVFSIFREFTAHCVKEDADQAVHDGALAMAFTAVDMAQDDGMRRRLTARAESIRNKQYIQYTARPDGALSDSHPGARLIKKRGRRKVFSTDLRAAVVLK